MKAVVQRVSRAQVRVAGEVTGSIEGGLLVFLGAGPLDNEATARQVAAKVVALRIFLGDDGRMNRSVSDAGGAVLAVSQFTLYGDVRRGNRPSFAGAAAPEHALAMYERFCSAIEDLGVECARGVFGAHMEVELVNDGPVTILLDSGELGRPRR